MKNTTPTRALFTGLLLAAGLTHAADYSAWTGSRDIVLNTSASGANVANDVTKFPVLIRLSEDEAAIIAASKVGGADIRFSKADETTPLPYEIENWEPWGASIWVLVDTVYGNNSTQKIVMHYGNPAATSESNPGAVHDTANGFVAAWHFGNGPGSVRPAAVPGAPFAFVHNSDNATSVKGLIGRADTLRSFGGASEDPLAGNWIDLSRDSSGAALTTPFSGYTAFPDGISYSIWVRPDGTPNYWRILVMAPSDPVQAGDRVLFMGGVADPTRAGIRWTNGCPYQADQATNPCNFNNTITNGVWNHFFFTKPAGDSPVQMYVNGELKGTSSNVGDVTAVERAIAWIGRAGDNNPYFTGVIDNATLAGTARSADFVKLSYENQKAVNSLVDIGLGGPVTSTPYGAWDGHRTITLNTTASGANVKGDVANFPVLIRLTSAEGLILEESKADGSDVRFSKIDDATPIPFHVESWDSAGAAIWVKLDTVKGNSNTQKIRMHWGNEAATSLSDAAVVFDTAHGHAAVFHMNQAAGDVVDATANEIVGTNVGTTPVRGHIGWSRNFGGTNAANTESEDGRQYINLNNPDALNFTGRISMSAWVRWTNLVGTENATYYRTFLNRDGTSPSAEVFLRIGHNAGNAEHAQYTTGKYTGSADIMAQSPQFASEYPDSAMWTHVAGVYDSAGPTTRVWRLYRNGVQIAQSEDNADAAVTGESVAWRIGRGPGTGAPSLSRWFVGDMDEVRIDYVTRDSNYIKLSYENQKAGNSLVDIGTYVPPSAPGAPTGVTAAVGTAGGTVTVSWTAPAFTGTAPITTYTVSSNPAGGNCYAAPPALTCTVIGLTGGTSYTFTVTAANSVGTSGPSSPSNAVTPTTSLLPGAFVIRMDGSKPYSYRIPASLVSVTDHLTMTIVNVHGKRVWSKSINPAQSKVNELTWDGRTLNGMRASAGMYIVRIEARMNGQTITSEHKGVNLKP